MKLLTSEEEHVLRRLLCALRGAEKEFVLVGGQAARLYRLHPWARPLEWSPLVTSDLDLATSDKGHGVQLDLGKQLLEQNFQPNFSGDHPPVVRYALGNAEVEVIVPYLKNRRHQEGPIVTVMGLTAQKVDDLEPLLIEPIELYVPEVGRVRLPNPAAYLIQKTLTLTNRRELTKQGKDALYVHDTLQLFSSPGLHQGVVEHARGVLATLHRGQRKRLTKNVDKLATSTTDFVREAATQARGRPAAPGPEAIAASNRLGFGELLAPRVG